MGGDIPIPSKSAVRCLQDLPHQGEDILFETILADQGCGKLSREKICDFAPVSP